MQAQSTARRWLVAAGAYALLIVYASLFPLSGWTATSDPLGWLRLATGPRHLPRADLLVNVLAYVPLGLAIAAGLSAFVGRASSIALAAFLGFCLSFGIETAQSYLPSRVSSLSDLLANSLGSLLGGLSIWLVGSENQFGRVILRLRENWIRPGKRAQLGLVALGLWGVAQLSPLLPSPDLGNLRQGLAPLVRVLTGERGFGPAQLLEYAFATAGLALISVQIVRQDKHRWAATVGFFALVLLLKIPVINRQLSLEALLGTAAGMVLAASLARSRGAMATWAAVALIVASMTVEALAPGVSARLGALNWTPFRAHLENPLVGINAILDAAWCAFALGWLVRSATPAHHGRVASWTGGVVLTLLSLGLEYAQQFIPGRVGDVTTAVIAALAWALAWHGHGVQATVEAPTTAARRLSPKPRRAWARRIAGVTGLLMLGGAVRWAVSRPPREEKLDKQQAPKLPAPGELPAPSLPGFVGTHPRLPAPTQADIATLRTVNPRFIQERRRAAREGRGAFDACAFSELAQPGSQDLDLLARRLTELKFTWRGHEQGRALALVYDWLHGSWTNEQRRALQEKLVEGGEYLIKVIREDRMSPYNVYLYNAPLQALMACALALYRDHPGGDAIMAFTHDFWKNRVLPVWRQVMGRNGGWHEGGEYVGIGIGQAIYQLPAMWRSATGENLFRTEPGIRGFLDFLVHRTQPDGSHLRWGDGLFFDRTVTDAAALALEFRHSAAYTLRPAPKNQPTGWPWGSLAGETLRDPDAIRREPLTRLFDGIGLLVARNRWSKDATQVSFKAGDNYWSHVHLDQGAFTIYRGAPLALDSGFYGPGYGSDHHMNYSYQTVAHNTITVTDPDDRVPAPAPNDKEKPRPIANDGGQRRVGSGWGVERAPLDRAEWDAKRLIYHTGRIVAFVDEDGISAALADITPAYTNELSGSGTFTHRTRRVERAWRFFAYDAIDDYVVVYDEVRATRPEFRKRWLLHSMLQPQIGSHGFLVRVPPQPSLRREGGDLEGHVVLPRRPVLNALGGRGFEFFVDGKNYDENGKLLEHLERRQRDPFRPEPGSWRIELSPEAAALDDLFLVVLVPSQYGGARPHTARLIEQEGRVGVSVVGPARTVRWWFTPGQLQARIEIEGRSPAGTSRVIDVQPGRSTTGEI